MGVSLHKVTKIPKVYILLGIALLLLAVIGVNDIKKGKTITDTISIERKIFL